MASDRQRAALARRIDAAIALTGREKTDVVPELAAAAEMGVRTFQRVLAGDRPLELEKLPAIAAALDVPLDWLLYGFEGAPEGSVEGRLDRLEAKLDTLLSEIRASPRELTAVDPEDRPRVPTPGEGPAGLR